MKWRTLDETKCDNIESVTTDNRCGAELNFGCVFSRKNRSHINRSRGEEYFLFLSPSLQLFCVATGTMDEVLASLQRGQIQLRKVSHPRMASPAADHRSDLMSAIRKGVTLKKVRSCTKQNKTFADVGFWGLRATFKRRNQSCISIFVLVWKSNYVSLHRGGSCEAL